MIRSQATEEKGSLTNKKNLESNSIKSPTSDKSWCKFTGIPLNIREGSLPS